MAFVLCAPLAVLAMPRSGTVAVVGSPLGDPATVADVVTAAGGVIVREGGVRNVLIAHSDEAGFVRRLFAAGAWLVLDPAAVGGCDPHAPATRPAPPAQDIPRS